MKNIRSLLLALIFVLCAGCSEKTPEDNNTVMSPASTVTPAPLAEDCPVIVADYYTDQLSNCGFIVEYNNITRTDFNFATADMLLTSADGKSLTINITAHIDYYKKDEKSHMQLAVYPGNVQIFGSEAIITTADKVLLVSLEKMELCEIQLDISALKDINGIAITAVKYNNGYAILYYSPNQDGVLLYNQKGKFLRNNIFDMPEWKIPQTNRVNWLVSEYEALTVVQQTMSSYMYTAGENSDMLLIFPSEKWPSKLLYDIKSNMLYGCSRNEKLVTETSHAYNFYEFNTNTGVDGKTFNTDNIYIVEKDKNGNREYVTFQFPQIDNAMMGFQLSEGENENQLILTHEATRREITVDFENKTINKEFNIPGSLASYRDGKLRVHDISPSGRYVLYIYDSFIPGSHTIYEIALLDTYTGKTKFVCENRSQLMGPWGKTGFLSDSKIYHYGEDYRIYSTDMNTTDYEFRLSDKFPLGHYKDESGDTIIHYAFDFARLDNGNYVVIYCHFPYNEGNATDYKYLISILDNNGNVLKTYDTGVYLPNEWLMRCEIYLEIDNSLMNIYAFGYDKADKNKLLNGIFSLETGEFIPSEPEN